MTSGCTNRDPFVDTPALACSRQRQPIWTVLWRYKSLCFSSEHGGSNPEDPASMKERLLEDTLMNEIKFEKAIVTNKASL